MKKLIALLLILAMVLTCFVACGKDDDTKEEKKTTTEEVTEDDTKETEEKKTTTEETTEPEPETTTTGESSGTSVDVKSIAGTYTCTFDANSDAIASLGEEVAIIFQLGLSMEITYIFREDMTCEGSVVLNGKDELLANLIVYSINAAAESAGMTQDEYWNALIEVYGSEEALEAALEEELAPTIEEIYSSFEGMGASATGTYEIDGNKIYATMDGETDEFTITATGLVVEADGFNFTLVRK